ncbi:MAG: hypothetical protein ACI9HU_000618, partial [Colwellia sp.]
LSNNVIVKNTLLTKLLREQGIRFPTFFIYKLIILNFSGDTQYLKRIILH